MRTKTLLIAAAALAAAVTSSQAQTVYSANVVGYVNTPLPGNGSYSLVANPVSGTTNGAEQILPGLQGGEEVEVWSGHGYFQYVYEGATVGTSIGYQSDWADGAAAPPGQHPAIPGDQTDASDSIYWAPQPVLAPGQGFFVLNGNSQSDTNTFTGTVITTNSVTIPGNGAYTLLSSAIPVGGDAETNTVINLANAFAGGEEVEVWSGHGYFQYVYEGATVGTSIGYQSDWADGAAAPPNQHPAIPGDQTDASDSIYWAPPLQLTVGQGFFVLNGNAASDTWTQTITNIP